MLQTFSERNLITPGKKQMWLGVLCWVMFELGFGLLFFFLFDTETQYGMFWYQISVFCACFLLTVLCFLPFLKQSLAETELRNIFPNIFKAFGTYCALAGGVSILLQVLNTFFPTDQINPNQETVEALINYSPIPMIICTVLLVPVTEECLVRGMLFGPICKKKPWLAYLISASVFSALHIIVGIDTISWMTVLENFLSYLPSGIVLGWMYQHSRTIVGPIMLHSLMNLIATVLTFLVQE